MKALTPELEAKITEARAWLFYGDVKEVAKRARTKPTRVSAMLNKKRSINKRVLDAAIEVMNENKLRFEIQPKMHIA